MNGKKLLAGLAVATVCVTGSPVQAQHGPGGGGHPGGHPGGHGGGGAHFHAPAGGFARGGHFTAPNGTWTAHPAWRGGGEFQRWQGGHWWRGNYEGRFGSWWIVGPDWYWYSTEVAPVPDPYTPAGMTPGYWYWCAAYQQYYPYIGACPTGWVPEPFQ